MQMSQKPTGFAHKRTRIAQARRSFTFLNVSGRRPNRFNVSETLTHGCATNTVMVANSLISAVCIFLNIHFGLE